jgi:hypothetical protein
MMTYSIYLEYTYSKLSALFLVPVTLWHGHGIYQIKTWFILGVYNGHTVT